ADREDAQAAADNGGPDGWALLDRIIAGAPEHLAPRGRLLFTIFDFLGVKTALAKLEAVGLAPSVLSRETQAFPRIGYERLAHLRAMDREATLPAARAAAADVRAEVEAQVAKFQKTFRRAPTHLDTHHHVGLHPPVREVVVHVARAVGVPVRSQDDAARTRARSAGLRTPDHFFGES